MTGRTLGVILVFLTLMTASTQSVTALTVSSYGFTPDSGGPGTVVHLAGTELYDDQPLTIWLVLSLETTGPGGMITKFQSLTKLGVTHPDPAGGHPNATFVIPGRLPDSSPITVRNLGIRLTDVNNQPIPEIGIKPFEFIPVPLPAAGEQTSRMWLLVLFACAFLTWGLLARKLENSS